MNIAPRINELLPAEIRDLLFLIGALADREDREVFLVGGMVRDIIMGRGTVDVDVVVNGDGPSFAAALATLTGGSIVLHDRFGTSVLILPDKRRVDVATARTETYSAAAALPDVSFTVIDYDLERRDFSVNAIAVALASGEFGEILDPFYGQADIAAGVIRVLHDGSFVDDPTRIWRAARFEQRFHFHIDQTTEKLLRAAVRGDILNQVSGTRIRNEVKALFEEREPSATVGRLQDFGVWEALVPGLHVGAEAVRIVGAIASTGETLSVWLKPDWRVFNAYLMGLAVDGSAEAARGLTQRLGLSQHSRRAVIGAVSGRRQVLSDLDKKSKASTVHRALASYSDAALVFFYAAGKEGVRGNIERFLVNRQIKSLISGRDLTRLGYRPSAIFTSVLEDVRAAQLDGVVTTVTEARSLAQHLMDSRKSNG